MKNSNTPKNVMYRLKEARTMSGLTLKQASKGLYMSASKLSKMEKEGCRLDSEQLIKFANFYKVRTDYLIPDENRPKVELTNIKFFKTNYYE